MTIVKIDDTEYEFDALSAGAKDQLRSVQFVDSEISRLTASLAVFQTARSAYIKALREQLQPPVYDPMAGDTIKLR